VLQSYSYATNIAFINDVFIIIFLILVSFPIHMDQNDKDPIHTWDYEILELLHTRLPNNL
jgi:hypothetical protein